MENSIITLCYRKIIDAKAEKPWEKMVFEDSYAEYRLQVQNFNLSGQYPSYGDLIFHQPEARQLNQRVTPAVASYVQQLGNVMPDILNNAGRRFIRFERFQLEIINSHLELSEKHLVAINFYSAPMVWHATIGNYILVSDPVLTTEDGQTVTNLMEIQPYLNVYSIQPYA